ncbi:hypothetical protein K491DRAFT_778721 [Lophiostoma macrostomum CBS 122681]|uniref:Uncharacterized protein n=1 Tax=Lophiostoma macrostomum CBS 122681 TaxID=1314788 RepID=A0A6A6T6N8_9PLEO|nr:hypothetical protein K491DRAFT_778721 [Lophiostoma macrostomum CBS 122681]
MPPTGDAKITPDELKTTSVDTSDSTSPGNASSSYEAKTVWRVRQVPESWTSKKLQSALSVCLKTGIAEVTIQSLATDFGQQGDGSSRTATVTFGKAPAPLLASTNGVFKLSQFDDYHDSGPQVFIDKDFVGFTPLSPVDNDSKHAIQCVLIHGLGGHAIASFTDDTTGFMWPRDKLPQAYPALQVWTYGYSSSLLDEDSNSNVYEWAESFKLHLRIHRRLCAINRRHPFPLIYIAHSLGGLILKEAMISMSRASESSEDRANILSSYGCLFFGVPSQGMDTANILTMIENPSARYTLVQLDQQVGFRLRKRQHADFRSAFHFEDSQVVHFFERDKTATLKLNVTTNKWERKGEKVRLVTPESATFGGVGNDSDDNSISIGADHSNMVKFRMSDVTEISKVLDVIDRFLQAAPTVINKRFGHQSSSSPAYSAFGKSPLLLPPPETRDSSEATPELPNNLPCFSGDGFYGREAILSKISRHFNDHTVQNPAFGLYGDGGVGKTQIALKYVHEHSRQYETIIWIYADTSDKVSSACNLIARNLNIVDEMTSDADVCRERLQKWYREHAGWILVFDNVETIADILPYWPNVIGKKGHIIVTSRNPAAARTRPLTDRMEVECFSVTEGVELLISELGDISSHVDRTIAEEVVKRAGCLPLAINHMASYISEHHGSLMDRRFLDEFDKQENLVLDEHVATGTNWDYEKTLATCWTLSIDSLRDPAPELLDILALYDPDVIVCKLLEHFQDTEAEALCKALSDQQTQFQALSSLQRFSLVKRRAVRGGVLEAFQIHRLIQDAVRRRWDSDQRWQQAFDRAIYCLSKLYPRQVNGGSMVASYPDCALYNTHIVSILRHYSKNKSKIRANLGFAEVLAHCGWYFYERGQIAVAEEILTPAKSICDRETLGRMNKTLALVYNNLAGVYFSKELVQLCAETMKICIQHRKACLDRTNPEIQELAMAYSNYANNLSDLGHAKEANTYYRKALDIRENCPGCTPDLMEHTLYNFAFFLNTIGQVDEAFEYMERALVQHSAISHVSGLSLYTLYFYGNLLWDREKFERACEIHKNCLRERTKIEGTEHYMTGSSMYRVGELLCAMESQEEGISHLRQALENFRLNMENGDKGLLPRTCLRLGKILIDRGSSIGDERSVLEGEELWKEGISLAWSRKNKRITSIDEVNGLVDNTFW